jgi:hypothetical protein
LQSWILALDGLQDIMLWNEETGSKGSRVLAVPVPKASSEKYNGYKLQTTGKRTKPSDTFGESNSNSTSATTQISLKMEEAILILGQLMKAGSITAQDFRALSKHVRNDTGSILATMQACSGSDQLADFLKDCLS